MKELMSLTWPSYIYEWASPLQEGRSRTTLVKVVETVNACICPKRPIREQYSEISQPNIPQTPMDGGFWSKKPFGHSRIFGCVVIRRFVFFKFPSWLNLSSPEHKQVQRWGKKKKIWNISSRHIFKMIPTVGVSARLRALTHRARCHLQPFHSQASLFVFIRSKAGSWNIIKNVSNIYWQLLYCYCLPVSSLAAEQQMDWNLYSLPF